jgi:hypothetical protein
MYGMLVKLNPFPALHGEAKVCCFCLLPLSRPSLPLSSPSVDPLCSQLYFLCSILSSLSSIALLSALCSLLSAPSACHLPSSLCSKILFTVLCLPLSAQLSCLPCQVPSADAQSLGQDQTNTLKMAPPISRTVTFPVSLYPTKGTKRREVESTEALARKAVVAPVVAEKSEKGMREKTKDLLGKFGLSY